MPMNLIRGRRGRRSVAAVLVPLGLVALAGSGCTEASVAIPSPLGNNRLVAVETFVGTLPLGATRFYSFAVPQTGVTSIVLLSLRENGAASSATVQLGLGVPRGTDCTTPQTVTVGVGIAAQIAITVEPAIYCARIADVGNLTASAEFAININRPR